MQSASRLQPPEHFRPGDDCWKCGKKPRALIKHPTADKVMLSPYCVSCTSFPECVTEEPSSPSTAD